MIVRILLAPFLALLCFIPWFVWFMCFWSALVSQIIEYVFFYGPPIRNNSFIMRGL